MISKKGIVTRQLSAPHTDHLSGSYHTNDPYRTFFFGLADESFIFFWLIGKSTPGFVGNAYFFAPMIFSSIKEHKKAKAAPTTVLSQTPKAQPLRETKYVQYLKGCTEPGHLRPAYLFSHI